jgi:hypothetical protein
MKDLVYIASMGVNDLVKKFSDKEDLIRFPNISSEYFGELINKYFSFSGFYTIENIDGKNITLSKLGSGGERRDYKVFDIVFPEHTSALQTFANNGISLVKGEINSKKFEGTLKKSFGTKYSIYINKKD